MPSDPEPLPPDSEETLVSDEAAIGRGLKWSVVALAVLAVLGAGIWLFLGGGRSRTATHVTQLAAPQVAARPVAAAPAAKFTDVTAGSGITFHHANGATGEKLLPETMGGGVAFFDFNGDGRPDLLFINGTAWPWTAGGAKTTAALYRNDSTNGFIRFTEVTAGSGLDVPIFGMGVATGDFDNDGRPDVLITGVGGAHLFHNDGGGHFTDVTAAAGVGGDAKDWSTAAVWFDYDNDGRLDLFVANYVRWSRELDAEVGYKIDGTHRAYGPPMNFQGAFSRLYHNEGNGRFKDVSETSGIQVRNSSTGVPAGKSLGVTAVDLNHDGYPDLVVANDTVQNFVFENTRDGKFREVGGLTGLGFDGAGNTRGAMGIDAARFTADGKMAVTIGNFANEMTAFYVAKDDPMLFTDDAIAWGIGPASRLLLKFGVFFFDYDLDGRLDVLTCNGHLEEDISKVQASQSYKQPAQLFWNAGDGGLVPVGTQQAGADLFQPRVGRGSAYADIDGDGDLDVVLTQVGGAPLLLRNDQSTGHHFVRLKLEGSSASRDAVGAWVELVSGGVHQWRQVAATRGYLSCSELPVTFGLGPTNRADSVEITWPGGGKQTLKDLPLDRLTVIQQPR
jgi:hypothetical protein